MRWVVLIRFLVPTGAYVTKSRYSLILVLLASQLYLLVNAWILLQLCAKNYLWRRRLSQCLATRAERRLMTLLPTGRLLVSTVHRPVTCSLRLSLSRFKFQSVLYNLTCFQIRAPLNLSRPDSVTAHESCNNTINFILEKTKHVVQESCVRKN